MFMLYVSVHVCVQPESFCRLRCVEWLDVSSNHLEYLPLGESHVSHVSH